MLDNVCKKIELALQHLRARRTPHAARMDHFCRALGEALLSMEFSPATALACIRAIRNRVDQAQALRRPHPVATVHAITLEVLQEMPETAALFSATPAPPREWNRKYHAAKPHSHEVPAAAEQRVKHPLAFETFRGFKPAFSLQPSDAYRKLDRKSMQRHLRQIGRGPRRPEPPGDFRGMSHV